jgi:hypothetical protein
MISRVPRSAPSRWLLLLVSADRFLASIPRAVHLEFKLPAIPDDGGLPATAEEPRSVGNFA